MKQLKEELKERMREDSGYLIAYYPKLYSKVIGEMIKPLRNKKIDKVMSPEMKGVIYGSVVANKLKIPFVPILKSGRIPKQFVISKEFRDYSKKIKSLDIAKITIKKGDRILLVDDAYDSGASGKAIIKMIEKLGGKVIGISIIYNKLKEKDEKFFKKYNFHYLVKTK